MPWLASTPDTDSLLAPHDATGSDDLACPHCGDKLYITDSYTRSGGAFVARHFSHYPTKTQSSADGRERECYGESDTHQRRKAITLSKLRHTLSDHIAHIDTEVQIGDRRADIGATFSEDLEDLGGLLPTQGALGTKLAVEVQYRHEDKDKQAVTQHYLNHGYSVLWLEEPQFSGKDVALLDGTGQTWIPIYPHILDPEILDNANIPACWATHTSHLPDTATPETTVSAAIPPHWYTTKLKQHLSTTGSGPQYKRWVSLFPDLADTYKIIAEKAIREPDRIAQSLTQKLYPYCKDSDDIQAEDNQIPVDNAVCGNCRYSEDDDYRDSEAAIICWRNKPDDSSNRPRKLTVNDNFAIGCSYFSYRPSLDESTAEKLNIHPSIRRPYFLDSLRGTGPPSREQRKAALKYAYYQTFGNEDWCDNTFSPAREEALLRALDSTAALPSTEDCS